MSHVLWMKTVGKTWTASGKDAPFCVLVAMVTLPELTACVVRVPSYLLFLLFLCRLFFYIGVNHIHDAFSDYIFICGILASSVTICSALTNSCGDSVIIVRAFIVSRLFEVEGVVSITIYGQPSTRQTELLPAHPSSLCLS